VSVCQCFNHAAGRQPARVQYSGIYSPSSLADVIVIAPPRGVDRDLRAKLQRSHDKLIPDAFIRPTQRDAGRKLASTYTALLLPTVIEPMQSHAVITMSTRHTIYSFVLHQCGNRDITAVSAGFSQVQGMNSSHSTVQWMRGCYSMQQQQHTEIPR